MIASVLSVFQISKQKDEFGNEIPVYASFVWDGLVRYVSLLPPLFAPSGGGGSILQPLSLSFTAIQSLSNVPSLLDRLLRSGYLSLGVKQVEDFV